MHADHVERDAARFAVLVVPNVGALTHVQCAQLRAFVASGGGLVVSGEASGYDDWGNRRDDLALADVLGVHTTWTHHGASDAPVANWETYAGHTYLRVASDTADGKDVMRGFDETDLLPFGGRLDVVRTDADVDVALTWVPPFPIYPPEKSWMAVPETELAAVTTRTHPGGGRVAYLAADLDRGYARHHHPDHGRLLANVVRWAARDEVPLAVEGAGVVDCHLYRQGNTLLLHLVNLDQGGAWRGRLEELTPSGPFTVRVRLPDGAAVTTANLHVAGRTVETVSADGWVSFEVARIADHEVVGLG